MKKRSTAKTKARTVATAKDGNRWTFATMRRPALAILRDVGRAGLLPVFGWLGLAVVAAGLLIWLVEGAAEPGMFRRLFDGVWWAVVTVATVGYGDKYPTTDGGRVVGILLILSGIVLTSLISGSVAAIFVERRIREGKGLQKLKLRNHLVICGWNPGALSLLRDLERRPEAASRPIVLVAMLEAGEFDALSARFPGLDLRFVRGDATEEATLVRASTADAACLLMVPDLSGGRTESGADERTILSCLAARSLKPDLPISAEILRPESEQHLRRAKVDEVVISGEISGFLLSASSVSRGLPRAARSLLSAAEGGGLHELPMPRELLGKSFSEASAWFLASGKGVLIGLLTEERGVSLQDLLGDDSSAIDAFIKRKFQEAQIDLAAETIAGSVVSLAPPPDYVIRESDAAYVVTAARSAGR